jgi:elongation of very long chain fatty acids protein 7
MKNRKAFQLKNTLVIYNFAQVILSVILVVEVSTKITANLMSSIKIYNLHSFNFPQGLEGGWWNGYSFRCQPVDYSRNPMAMRVIYQS